MNRNFLRRILPGGQFPGTEGPLDFTSLLAAVNVLAAAATAALWFARGPNDYVNLYALLLSAAFAAQNHFLLLSGKKSGNPFLTLLVFCSIFFYQMRVASLLALPWSAVLPRNPFPADNLAHALLFVIAANFFIFLGVTLAGPARGQGPGPEEPPVPNLPAAVSIFLLALLANWGCAYAGRLQGYLVLFFNLDVLLLLMLVYLLPGFAAGRPNVKFSLLALLLGFLALRTMLGSRSALLTVIFSVICALLSSRARILIPRKLLLPVLLAGPLSMLLFMVGSNFRGLSAVIRTRNIFDRTGFLDMTADILSNAQRYSGVINGGHYLKSVVDSSLTPGFSLFDAPKASNSLFLVYNGYLDKSLYTVAHNYQADMFTVYGEAFALFGPVFGLIAIGVVSFLFASAYRAFGRRGAFVPAALRAVLLYIFYYYFLNSFGFDWFLVDLFRGAVPFLLFLWIFSRLEHNDTGIPARG